MCLTSRNIKRFFLKRYKMDGRVKPQNVWDSLHNYCTQFEAKQLHLIVIIVTYTAWYFSGSQLLGYGCAEKQRGKEEIQSYLRKCLQIQHAARLCWDHNFAVNWLSGNVPPNRNMPFMPAAPLGLKADIVPAETKKKPSDFPLCHLVFLLLPLLPREWKQSPKSGMAKGLPGPYCLKNAFRTFGGFFQWLKKNLETLPSFVFTPCFSKPQLEWRLRKISLAVSGNSSWTEWLCLIAFWFHKRGVINLPTVKQRGLINGAMAVCSWVTKESQQTRTSLRLYAA